MLLSKKSKGLSGRVADCEVKGLSGYVADGEERILHDELTVEINFCPTVSPLFSVFLCVSLLFHFVSLDARRQE